MLEARSDFQKYNSSSRTIENMLVATQGPVFRRPGTKYIASQKTSSAAGRVVAFEHSVDDNYILLFENEVLRFFRDGGQILDGVGTETLTAVDGGALVAHWLLNEDEGVTVVNADNAGTYDGTASTDCSTLHADGKVGTGCFDLDGQYTVEIADAAAFSFSDDSNDTTFSFACWAYITQLNDLQVLLSKWRDDNSAREWRFSLTNDRKLQLHLADASADLSGDRIAQWKLNEDAANTTVLDTDATSHDGTTQVGNTEDVNAVGKISGAFDFGGAESVVITNDHAELSFGDGTDDSPFSISAWVKASSTAAIQHIFSKYDATAGSEAREYRLLINAIGGVQIRLYDESAPGTTLAQADAIPRTIVADNWYLITVTYDGSGGSSAAEGIKIYVNGTDATFSTHTFPGYTAMENLATKVVIGAYYDATGILGQFFDGLIDNVVLFNKELTQANVSALWNDGSGTETMASAEVSAVTDNAVSLGWHFLTCTYSAPISDAADGIIFYVDGEAVDSTATNDATYTAMQGAGEAVRIGSQNNSADDANEKFWEDKIDEVSIFSDVLTPTEVASLYSTTPYEITTPYLTADLFGLDFIKSEDVMYITHSDYEPRQLSRAGHSLWTMEALGIDDGPFQEQNTDTTFTITPSAATGSITLTASDDFFVSGHIGSVWQIDQPRASSVFTATINANESGAIIPYFVGGYSFTTTGTWTGTVTLQRSSDDGANWSAALTALVDTNFDNPAETEVEGAIYRVTGSSWGEGNCVYTFTIADQDNHGVVEITGVDSGTVAVATVLTDLVNTDATSLWREGYWSDYRGWPQTVTVHQQRLVFGGSESFPQTIWFGKADPDDYTNFTEGTLDTSAFTIALPGQNPIEWLLSQDYLLVGTAGSCGKYGEQSEAITPTSPIYQEQTRHGSASIRGVIAGDTVLYIERGSRKVREFAYSLQFDKYLSPELTILSPEITDSGIKDVAFQLRSDPVLWCVLNNGDIATLTYQREQLVIAWTKQITDGDFESVAIISGDDEDEVWVSVRRTIEDSNARYVEQFQPFDWGSDANDCWYVDSGLSYDDTDANSFSGLDHLIGESVSIYADTLIESPEVVDANGEIVIDNDAARVLAGLPYTSKLETLPLVIAPQDKATNKKIRTVSFDFYETGACQYTNGANGTLENINFKNSLILDPNATAQDLYTSTVSFKKVYWPFGSRKKQTIYLESSQPMPLTIRSITPNYDIYP